MPDDDTRRVIRVTQAQSRTDYCIYRAARYGKNIDDSSERKDLDGAAQADVDCRALQCGGEEHRGETCGNESWL